MENALGQRITVPLDGLAFTFSQSMCHALSQAASGIQGQEEEEVGMQHCSEGEEAAHYAGTLGLQSVPTGAAGGAAAAAAAC